MPPRKRSIATVSLSGTLEEKLAAAARAGFDGVEVFENDFISCRLPAAEVRARAQDLGLAIMMYQPFRDLEAVPEELFERNLRRATQKFEVMAALGTNMLLVCSNVSAPAIDDDARATDQLCRLAERASAHDIRIAYEALAWGRWVNDYVHAWKIVAAADHPNLGVCLDSFHILSLGHDSGAIRDIPGEKIFFLQLADAPHLTMDPVPWSRHYRCFPGQGGFDLADFTADVLASGYAGPWSIEVFNDTFRRADAERTAIDAMRSLLVLEESLRSGDSAGLDRVDLPAAADLSGYAFVEIAIDPQAEPAAEHLLTGLGFTRGGRHRTKPVRLWQQADARVLINRSGTGGDRPAGDAIVAAIALESSDPVLSADRARALLAPAIPRGRGPGEAHLSAVAAPDGTSVFFCRTDVPSGWLGDFESSPVAETRPLLTGVDHVALPQPFDYFEEAGLFYQSLLGMRRQGSEELASPYGLVRSRAVRSRSDSGLATAPSARLRHDTGAHPLLGGGVRLVLNVPLLGGGSLPDTAVYQHVAFTCVDIFAVALSLRERGIRTLPIPDNYYDDLAVRFDLDSTVAASMRELGVLYDRDESGGEFFHLYTMMLSRGLFFEVVQRTGGYDGYGAPNTPIRMAAQLREPRSEHTLHQVHGADTMYR